MQRQRDYKREYETALARGDNKNYKNVSTKVPADIHAAFKQKAEKNGECMGSLIRQWIEDYLAK